MRRVTLSGTDIEMSRLSFGTGSLHHLPFSRGRQNLLSAAHDHGFTHFDTAPYYGFGLAEEELGRFIRGRRGRVTTATKFGIYPPGGVYPSFLSVLARKAAGKLIPRCSRPRIDWSCDMATKSLELSLKRLRVERIDLLLLHEPDQAAVQSQQFLDWFRTEKDKGKIGAWGLAGQADCMNAWLSNNHPLGMVLQVRDSLERKEADLLRGYSRDLQITFGYLSAASAAPVRPAFPDILREALRRNVGGSILVSTRHLARVGELAAAAGDS